MNKSFTILVFSLVYAFLINAQTNLIQNPGFEASPSIFTVPVGSPAVNYLMKVTNNAAATTDISQPTASSVSVTDGLWVKRQTVSSSSLQAYLAPGGANGSATYLFLKIAGGNNTAGFDWTKMSAQQRVPLSNTMVYTFSFWAKVGNAVNTVYAYLTDKTGDTGSATFTKAIPLTGGTAWTKYTVTFDIPSERAAKPTLDYSTSYIGVGINALYTSATPPLTQNNWLYVDDFELIATTQSLVPTITSTTTENVYIKTNPIPVTITFDADVTGFTISDLVVTNGSAANFIAVNAKTYMVNIIPSATGKVTLDIPAGAAADVNARQSVASNQFVRLFNNEVTTGDYINLTTICPAKDNKTAVYTFTADDGFTDAATFYNNEFKRLDLVGSLALVANWINGSQTPASTYEFWNGILADGRFDIINHSKTHVKFTTISNTQIGQDSLRNEIIGNQTVFRSKFPGQDIITMANPAVVNTDAADVLIKQSHYAARNGTSGYNSLSPTEAEWYKLKMMANYFGSLSRPAYSIEINKYIDSVIANKQWLILLTHGIGTGANAMPDTAFTKHFEYVASKRADLWIGTFGDVTRYFREKQNATLLTIDSTASKIGISLTHNLDGNIFDYPLTLKTKLPAGWTSVKVTQGAVSMDSKAVVENGASYIYYDAIPNGGTVVLTPNNTMSVGLALKKNASNLVAYQTSASTLTIKDVQSGMFMLKIINTNGQECGTYSLKDTQNSIDIGSLTPGVYIVKQYSNTSGVAVLKVIVK